MRDSEVWSDGMLVATEDGSVDARDDDRCLMRTSEITLGGLRERRCTSPAVEGYPYCAQCGAEIEADAATTAVLPAFESSADVVEGRLT